MKKYYLVSLVLLVHFALFAQNQKIETPDQKTDWWGDIDGYLNQQAKVSLTAVTDVFKLYPPEKEERLERKMAFLLIDNVLHEEKAASRPAVHEFLQNQIKNAVDEIRSEKVKKGAVIWKLYNHSFVVKTKSTTIGFDIQRGLAGESGLSLTKELMQPLIDVVDVLFISHYHSDHTDEWIAEKFLEQGKFVISPPEVFASSTIYSKILHPDRDNQKMQELALPSKGVSLKFVNHPGHQGTDILNNVYLVFTPEGYSFAQTGDQSNQKDFEWIDRVGDSHRVDVLFPNCWTSNPARLAKGFRPKLIITGHENEMGHTIDHREPFWLNANRWSEILTPRIQMAWGEKFHYLPAQFK
jgi:L-ascorbate metabolism protein UlaG (beta-lactamase superfamily)